MTMFDREKVINDLQDAVNDDWMWQHADYYAKAMENALALLKEQETVAVHDPGAYCPKCGWMLYPEDHPHHCGNCGQEVKWEL